MVLRGAQLTPREADTVLAYLVANFGPGAPAPGSVTLPGGAGKELVETRCAVCHSLERVTAVKRPARDWDTIVANMYDRWGVSATDEAQAITSYLASASSGECRYMLLAIGAAATAPRTRIDVDFAP